ncbi:MAG: hypothetical protein ACKVPX_08925 [Myxococcaceae bacterium]
MSISTAVRLLRARVQGDSEFQKLVDTVAGDLVAAARNQEASSTRWQWTAASCGSRAVEAARLAESYGRGAGRDVQKRAQQLAPEFQVSGVTLHSDRISVFVNQNYADMSYWAPEKTSGKTDQ